MKLERIGYVLLLVALLVISGAALSAQTGTEEPVQSTAEATPEILFNDLRVNNRIVLGEFGIFCEDANGNPATSYQNGRIAVYGADGEQYIFVEEDALRQMSGMDDANATAEASPMPTNTARPNATMMQNAPVLLGQANARHGVVQLFLTGDNQFQLNGYLPDGKGFSYFWTGCAGTAGVTTFEGTQVFVTTTPVATLPAMTSMPTTTAQPTLDLTPGVTETVSP